MSQDVSSYLQLMEVKDESIVTLSNKLDELELSVKIDKAGSPPAAGQKVGQSIIRTINFIIFPRSKWRRQQLLRLRGEGSCGDSDRGWQGEGAAGGHSHGLPDAEQVSEQGENLEEKANYLKYFLGSSGAEPITTASHWQRTEVVYRGKQTRLLLRSHYVTVIIVRPATGRQNFTKSNPNISCYLMSFTTLRWT